MKMSVLVIGADEITAIKSVLKSLGANEKIGRASCRERV